MKALKLVAAVMALSLVFALASCDKKVEEDTTEADTTVAEDTEAEAEDTTEAAE